MSGIKVSFGDISFGVEDIRRLAAAQWPIVGGREAVVTCSEPVRDEWKARAEEAERELVSYTASNMLLKDALETAERERDEARELRDSARALNSKLMENLEFHKRSGREQDVAIGEFRRQLAAAVAANCCKSCEGPLTCAKCTVKEHQSSLLNDHEVRLKVAEKDLGAVMRHMPDLNRQVGDHDARIKAMDTLVQAMGERVNDHERRLRAREGKPK